MPGVSYLPWIGHKTNLVVGDLFVMKKNTNRDKTNYESYNKNVATLNAIILKCRKLVSKFRYSIKLTELLKKKQELLGMKKLALVQEVPTRWSSTYNMLDSIVTNYQAIKSCARRHAESCWNQRFWLFVDGSGTDFYQVVSWNIKAIWKFHSSFQRKQVRHFEQRFSIRLRYGSSTFARY